MAGCRGGGQDTPFVSAARWEAYYGKVARLSKWGTIRAVQQFAEEVDRQLFITWMRPDRNKSQIAQIDREGAGCYAWPAWYIVK